MLAVATRQHRQNTVTSSFTAPQRQQMEPYSSLLCAQQQHRRQHSPQQQQTKPYFVASAHRQCPPAANGALLLTRPTLTYRALAGTVSQPAHGQDLNTHQQQTEPYQICATARIHAHPLCSKRSPMDADSPAPRSPALDSSRQCSYERVASSKRNPTCASTVRRQTDQQPTFGKDGRWGGHHCPFVVR